MAYKVASGDTLSAIARANNTTVAAIQALNPSITDPNKIYIGQSLNLPTVSVSPTPTSTSFNLDPSTGKTATLNAPTPLTINTSTQNLSTSAMSRIDPATGKIITQSAPTPLTMTSSFAPPTTQQSITQQPIIQQPVVNPNQALIDSTTAERNRLQALLDAGIASGQGYGTGKEITGTLPSEVTTANQLNTGLNTYTPPPTTAYNEMNSYTASMLATLEQQKTALETEYNNQLKNIQTQKDTAQANQDALIAQQKNTIEGEVKDLTTPFRVDLETAERQRLKVEENFFANQQLTNELGTLLTDIQTQLQAEKNITGLASIRQPRIAQATELATARVGTIEAVMAARNNQITVAENMIDRTVGAITADRQDQLSYYNSLLNFYDSQADAEGNKVITLSKQEQDLISNKVDLLKADLAQSQANADYIKKLMLDPNYATLIGKSGVTLNDSPTQVQQKFANYSYQEEVRTESNTMSADGYTFITPEQALTKPAGTVVKKIDSDGVVRNYYKAATDNRTASIKEYEYAVSKGYSGSFEAWKNSMENEEETKYAVSNSYLANQGIPLIVADTKGYLTETALQDIIDNGVPYDIAQYIWANMSVGASFDEIRQQMVTDSVDTLYLDKFVQALQ